MGAGVSVANNAAQAVASAVTSVVNSTNVFNEQSNDQKQDIVLNACDIVAQKNVNINQTTGLQQSLTQIATIASTTSVSNDVAQALSQAAASQVGAGVLGVADASNMASTYASMATNVSNYVQLSAKQLSKTQQTFECNDSTIVGDNITISQVDIANVTQFTNDNVSNSTDVTNKIKQTIEQTASATTGFSIGGIIALIVALAVIALAVKMFSKPNNPNNPNDPNDPNQTHSQRILNAVQQGHTHDTVVDLDNVRVSKATWIIYGVMIVLFGLVICAWYISAGMQGCLFDDACGTRVGAVGGCSCNFNETGDGTNVCKDTTSASFTSTGIPLKYQYVLPFRQAQSVMCASAGSTSTASMQGILVSYFKTQSMTINANNGKNLDTLLRYVQMCAGAWPSGPSVPSLTNMHLPSNTRAVQSIVNMFRAGAKYLATLTDASASMKLLTSCLVENDDNYVQSGIRLALLCCPLRPVFVTTSSSTATTAVPATWPNSNLTQTCLTVDTTDTISVSNWTSSADLNNIGDAVYLVRIPQAFTSVIPPDWPGGTDTNANAGCCSTRMVWYMDSMVDPTDSFAFTCACGDASSGGEPDNPTLYYLNTGTFCNGCASGVTSCAPKNNGSPGSGVAGATTTGPYVDAQTGQVKMQLPGATLPKNCTDSSTDGGAGGAGVASMMDAYPLTGSLADNWGLQYYAELATFNFGSDEDAQQAYSFVRLMWTGIMAAIGDQPADTVFGTNCMLVNPGAVDHYYVADQTGQGFGKVGSSLDDQAGMVDDKTLLRIKLMNASKYDCKLGLPPVACSGIGDTGQTQSYIGSSAALGYCRDWFLNDYSRIVMFVLAALAVLWLPMFVVVRIYINRGTGKILVQDAQAHLKKSGKSIMVAPQPDQHNQPNQPNQPNQHNQHNQTTSPDSQTAKTETANTNNTNNELTNSDSPTSPSNSDSPTSPSNSDSPTSPTSPNSQTMVAPFLNVNGNPQPGDPDSPLEGGQSRPNKRRPAWLSLSRTAKR